MEKLDVPVTTQNKSVGEEAKMMTKKGKKRASTGEESIKGKAKKAKNQVAKVLGGGKATPRKGRPPKFHKIITSTEADEAASALIPVSPDPQPGLLLQEDILVSSGSISAADTSDFGLDALFAEITDGNAIEGEESIKKKLNRNLRILKLELKVRELEGKLSESRKNVLLAREEVRSSYFNEVANLRGMFEAAMTQVNQDKVNKNQIQEKMGTLENLKFQLTEASESHMKRESELKKAITDGAKARDALAQEKEKLAALLRSKEEELKEAIRLRDQLSSSLVESERKEKNLKDTLTKYENQVNQQLSSIQGDQKELERQLKESNEGLKQTVAENEKILMANNSTIKGLKDAALISKAQNEKLLAEIIKCKASLDAQNSEMEKMKASFLQQCNVARQPVGDLDFVHFSIQPYQPNQPDNFQASDMLALPPPPVAGENSSHQIQGLIQ